MTLKAKLIIVGVAMGVLISLVAHRYLGCAAQVLEHLTAGVLIPGTSLVQSTAGFGRSLLSS